MIILEPTRMHWIKDDGADDPFDLCAHSPVRFEVGDKILVAPDHGDFTVSAAAIYLLRTLERNHTADAPVGDQLFPCCGHSMHDTGDEDVWFCGCPNGIDVFITHEADGRIRLTQRDGQSSVVSMDDWCRAVSRFSDCVRAFYDDSLPRTPSDDDAAGFSRMMTEWDGRRSRARIGERVD